MTVRQLFRNSPAFYETRIFTTVLIQPATHPYYAFNSFTRRSPVLPYNFFKTQFYINYHPRFGLPR